MPQSLSGIYIHVVFSTKDRYPFLRDQKMRETLHAYLGEVSKRLDCAPMLVSGVEDHVHILARFGRTISQAEWVKELRRVSNHWLKEQGPHFNGFEWQGGLCGLFRQPVESGTGKRIHRPPRGTSSKDDLSRRIADAPAQTPSRMG